MRKLVCVFYIAVFVSAFTVAEEAAVLEGKTFRYTQSVYFGFETEAKEGEQQIMAPGWGVGFEYGVTDWLNFQALWNPGVWGTVTGDYGHMSSAFLGTKACIWGKDSLLADNEQFRLTPALGIKIPLMAVLAQSRSSVRYEPDTLLWGSALRLYGDILIHDYFYINLFMETAFYPEQRANSSVFAEGTVQHYLDLTGEMELHFELPLAVEGVKIKGGVPLRIFYAPWLNDSDPIASDQWCFSLGGYLGVFLTDIDFPAEIMLRYHAPILGNNVAPVHRASLIFRVYVIDGGQK